MKQWCALHISLLSFWDVMNGWIPYAWLGTGTIAPVTVKWASFQIRKISGCACAGNAGNVFPRHRLQRKPLVNDPGMHHGACVTHVPWCMSGSLTSGGGGNVPGIPGACATRNFTYLARGALHELAKGYLANTKPQQNTTKHEPCA